jgi:hypothetical protein
VNKQILRAFVRQRDKPNAEERKEERKAKSEEKKQAEARWYMRSTEKKYIYTYQFIVS